MHIPFNNLFDSIGPIYREFLGAIERTVENTDFIGGKNVELFESEFASYAGSKYAIGAANGTDAIIIALKALGIGSGDAVLVPANTFIATAEAVSAVGANVYFIDVEDTYYTIDPSKIEEFIKLNSDLRVRAVIVVHLYGQMADMPMIQELSQKYGFYIIEDSAQAHGSQLNLKKPGYYGHVATFSFYPGKNIGAFGDAGAIVTNDEKLYYACKRLVNHGRLYSKYEHDIEGYNMRLDALQAAVLRIRLKYINDWDNVRKKKVQLYLSLLASSPVILPAVREKAEPAWHLFVIRINNRDEVKNELKKRGIDTGIHYPVPLHLQPAYASKGYRKGDFPVSEQHAQEILSLPLWPEMPEESVIYVVKVLNEALEKSIISFGDAL